MPVTKDKRQMTFDLGAPDARREAVREVVLAAVATATYAQVAAATGLTRHAVSGMVTRARRSGVEVPARPPKASPETLARNAAKALSRGETPVVVRVVPPEPTVLRAAPTPRERAAVMLRRRKAPPRCAPSVDLWTLADEREVTRRVAGGDDYGDIARDLGRSPDAVRKRASRLGVAKLAPGAWTPSLDAELLRLRQHGLDDQEAGRRIGRSASAVMARLTRLRELGHAVAPSPRCRYWSDAQVDAVVVRARCGEANVVIAAAIGRTRVAVEEMVRGLREQGRLPGCKLVDESEPGAVRGGRRGSEALLAALMQHHGRH